MNGTVSDNLIRFQTAFEELEKEEKYEECLPIIDQFRIYIAGYLSGSPGIVERPVLESIQRDLKNVQRILKLNIENKRLRDQLANHAYSIKKLEDQFDSKKGLE